MQKRWVDRYKADTNKVETLASALNINKVLATLLIQRGVDDFDQARNFFRPRLEHLHDPFLMKDMERAIGRIERAIGMKENILIYGDYDVDGTTSVAVLFSFLNRFYNHIGYYIPDRYKEGYGISTQGIDYAAQNNYSLIIALDCGIKSIDKVEYARTKGIDFIIGDHHTPGNELPQAVAVLDPKRKDCDYPYKELSGCGIAFKIIQAFAKINQLEDITVYQYLDLVAVSIASDIVPITGENRVLAYYGLKKLNNNPCFGLKALIDLATKSSDLSLTDVIFQIGPRINAAGRIDHAKDAVKLLIAKSSEEAKTCCGLIDIQNMQRKDFDARITAEALEQIQANEHLMQRKTTVVYQEDWHKGVIGIVASRLTEKYYRPTIVLTKSNGHVAGSARSVAGFDLYEALSECSDLLDQFGGHKYAAGLTMKVENVIALQKRFEEVVAQSIDPELLEPEISIDAEIKLVDITAKFFRVLQQFAPFGPENNAPVFIARNLYTVGAAALVGVNHLKMTLTQEGAGIFDSIGFGLGEFLPLINKGIPFDACFSIEENVWRDKRSLQLNLKGIRLGS
ncbi:single-stranded-DNA-specific exonuclease RecJ [Olivibacter domesticus]|uniref:Single-stranded-DNA-specific exonuclease RecJ n=1 Tax=Olivibacter domesticus TaxID=407022 RepID=A0A1H7TG95_OLID1|nr:single-stranded-DNA-specific exonuclease RecJ [Olivibacter domesticus]SEL83595.1 single-stranded-DNA-specific exonuclease [Olivibacter domesticus]